MPNISKYLPRIKDLWNIATERQDETDLLRFGVILSNCKSCESSKYTLQYKSIFYQIVYSRSDGQKHGDENHAVENLVS